MTEFIANFYYLKSSGKMKQPCLLPPASSTAGLVRFLLFNQNILQEVLTKFLHQFILG
jgi:hypothetical protein